jgi:hypothetical protein
MSERLSRVALTLLLAGMLVLVVTGGVRDMIVVPMLYMIWLAGQLYQSIPQALLWGVFLVAAVLVALQSLAWRLPPPLYPNSATAQLGRVAAWERLLRESTEDDYARWRLAQRLSAMAIATLADREQCLPHELRQRLADGSLDLPAEVRSYLRIGLAASAPASRSQRSFWRRVLAGRIGGAQLVDRPDLDPEPVIQFLEQTVQQTIGESR